MNNKCKCCYQDDSTSCDQHDGTGNYSEYCEIPEIIITDKYLLGYLLKKYKLDKNKIIATLKIIKEKEIKLDVIKEFYNRNKILSKRPFREHYNLFKQWNDSGFIICEEELESYYDKTNDC